MPAVILHLPLFAPNSDKCWPAVNDSDGYWQDHLKPAGRAASVGHLPAAAKAHRRAASIPFCRSIDAARRIVFERAQVLLDAALGLLAPLVLSARNRGHEP